MRTVPFKNVLYEVTRAAGLQPDTGDLTPELAATLTDFINNRLREAREWAWWPELTKTEVRAVSDSEERLIPLTETDKDTIEHVRWVTNVNPFVNGRCRYLPFLLNADGIQIPAPVTLPESLWVTYRPVIPRFDSTAWSNDVAYAAGDVRYLAATGECYLALEDNSAENPATSDKWEVVPFPFVLLNFVKYAAGADYLEENGQNEKAARKLDRAWSELFRLEDVENTQQRQVTQAVMAVG